MRRRIFSSISVCPPKKYRELKICSYLLYYVSVKNFSLVWRRHHCSWRAAEFTPMFSAQGLWAGRMFFTVPHLLWHGALVFLVLFESLPNSVIQRDVEDILSILTRIPQSSRVTRKGILGTYSSPNPHMSGIVQNGLSQH
jgi:hypothetical protein